MSKTRFCPKCDEVIVRKPPRPFSKAGWGLNVEPSRLEWSHASDSSPLCPVMTESGYQPAHPGGE